MVETVDHVHLAPRDASSYQQAFVKGRNLRAETLYRPTIGPEPMSPEDVARDYDVPVEAVREAIHYSLRNAALLQREREADWADSRVRRLVSSTSPESCARVDP